MTPSLSDIRWRVGALSDQIWARRHLAAARRRAHQSGWSQFASEFAELESAYTKYLDLDHYLQRDLQRAHEIKRFGGDRGTIVDLGTGMGFFPACCSQGGLACVGVEPLNPAWNYSTMFSAAHQLLAIDVLDHMISPNKSIPVPPSWRPISAVTANQIQFNKIGRGDDAEDLRFDERFGPDEWDFLLRDLASHADGPLFVRLSFNRPQSWSEPYSPKLRSYFEGLGATCRGSVVRIPALIVR